MKRDKKYIDIGREDGRKLEVSAAYQLGGTSFLTGKQNPRSYYLFFDLVEYKDHGPMGISTTRMLFSGDAVKLQLKEVARQSKKIENAVNAFMDKNLDEFVSLYRRGDRQGMLALANTFEGGVQ